MKLYTKTFGCQMNFADSDELGRHFSARGFQKTDQQETADAILVNTCTVRDLAEHKAASFIGRLRDWKAGDPRRLVIVTGCAAERAKDEFRRRFPHIDLIVGAKDIESFPRELDQFLAAAEPPIVNADAVPPAELSAGSGGVIQYVTIMRGCNYSCTYCIVPAVRGREAYRPVEEVLADARRCADTGAREIWLLGQTVNSYRPADRPGYDFAELLRDVAAAVPGVRLRYISPHPHYLTPRLIRAMAEVPALCEHIHLPVQSGSNDVLRRMKRNYTRESYLDNLRALRAAIPGIAVTTDIIAGFPGETEDDFRRTLALAEEAGFASAYCFKYSPRPGTAAAAWPDDVPEDVKERRVNELLALTEEQGRRQAEALRGTIQEILVEEDKGEGLKRGKTRTAWRVRLNAPALRVGDLATVRITGAHSRELFAEAIPAPVTAS